MAWGFKKHLSKTNKALIFILIISKDQGVDLKNELYSLKCIYRKKSNLKSFYPCLIGSP